MAKISLSRTAKKCALCKHWNGTIGCTSIKPLLGGNFQVEMTEKQICYIRTVKTTAMLSCQKFEPRY